MKTIRMVIGALLILGALVMFVNAVFCIYEMVSYRNRYQDSIHSTVRIVTWLLYFVAGAVMLAAVILLPTLWRKGLAAWGAFTCLVMMIAPFILSSRASYNEIGWLWIAAALWMTILSLGLGVAALLGAKAKPADALTATASAP